MDVRLPEYDEMLLKELMEMTEENDWKAGIELTHRCRRFGDENMADHFCDLTKQILKIIDDKSGKGEGYYQLACLYDSNEEEYRTNLMKAREFGNPLAAYQLIGIYEKDNKTEKAEDCIVDVKRRGKGKERFLLADKYRQKNRLFDERVLLETIMEDKEEEDMWRFAAEAKLRILYPEQFRREDNLMDSLEAIYRESKEEIVFAMLEQLREETETKK
ncbi:MAG: hypothetical protein K6E75_09430 [Lachnospiraceae bacterium]|nr:hypothetical protein [Lachnospiraceae bacterium]